MNPTRLLGRAATVTAVAAGALALAVPAFAHVEVESDTAQALATNVTVTFTAEAESETAGLAKFQVVLPEGIAPGDVKVADAPQGWTFAATADGYTVGGPALATGKDAVYRITIRQLPNAKELVFKTLETYGDGRIDRWIELPQGGAEPEHPAPILKLAAAAPGATTVSPSTVAPSSSAASSAPASPSAAPSITASATPAPAAGSSDSSPAVPIAVGAAAVVALAAGGAWWWRRRNRPAGS
ncbi:hypothetical protein GCM10010193_53050 [Kitasatospora atroaurantiaca]|uniref:Uncharacterized protein YcnI n=1 Tax=Kitasatospora atroaurantiaca TaxID=285545 RepID=A0A561EXJ1_9ACTN|nr:DUF1775 domain-containing protein [Kitasatospora atroaurantiaca]TWE20328.1 uncharacterized protein YcnI [Kitasatospora atroaurantiaca]